MKPHKHCELIKAWAEGAQIQIKRYVNEWSKDEVRWEDQETPTWGKDREYRIKPREFEEGAFYPAIDKHNQKVLIKHIQKGERNTFKCKNEFWADAYFNWIGPKLEIDWPEE